MNLQVLVSRLTAASVCLVAAVLSQTGDGRDQFFNPLLNTSGMRELKPLAYALYLHPNVTTKTFTGHVRITIKIVEETSIIRFMATGLNISTLVLSMIYQGPPHRLAILGEMTHPKDRNYGRLMHYRLLNTTLVKDDVIYLKATFSGAMNQAWRGMYYRSYFFNGQEKRSVFTEGEPYLMFPCLGEESHVARFRLSLVHDDHMTVLSNTVKENTRPYRLSREAMCSIYGAGESRFRHLKVTTFQRTQAIPPHTVSFALGELVQNPLNSVTGQHRVKVYAPPHQLHMTEYALNLAAQLFDKFGVYFNNDLHGQKLDIVAAGNRDGFSTSGLIFMSGAYLFYQEGVSPVAWKKEVNYQIALQIAKQWLGARLPIRRSSVYYIFDGFAAYVANWILKDSGYLSDEELALKYEQWRREIMEEDSLNVKRRAASIMGARDRSYNDDFTLKKGALIMKMVESVTSELNVKSAFRRMMELADNTTFTHFSRRFVEILPELYPPGFGQTIQDPDMMERNKELLLFTWFTNPGYPVVTLSQTGHFVHFTRQRFFNNQRWADGYRPPINATVFMDHWIVPFTYITSAAPHSAVTRLLGNTTGWLEVSPSAGWIKGRALTSGLYRVNYDPAGWEALRQQLVHNHTVLPADQRASLFEDAFALAKAGLVSYGTVLDLTEYISNETDERVRQEVATGLSFIKDSLTDKSHKALVTRYLALMHLSDVQEDENADDCGCGEHSSVSTSLLYRHWKNNDSYSISPHRVAGVYTFGARQEREDWDVLFYRSTLTPQYTNRLFMQTSLACTTNVIQLTRLLNYCLNPTKIDITHLDRIANTLKCSRGGRLVLFRFVRKNWQKLLDVYGAAKFGHDLDVFLLGPVIKALETFDSQFDLDELKTFIDQHYGYYRYDDIVLQTVQNKIDWRANFTESITNLLRERLPANATV